MLLGDHSLQLITYVGSWINAALIFVSIDNYIKYSLDFLHPIKTTEAFEAVDWLADLPQRTWPQVGRR